MRKMPETINKSNDSESSDLIKSLIRTAGDREYLKICNELKAESLRKVIRLHCPGIKRTGRKMDLIYTIFIARPPMKILKEILEEEQSTTENNKRVRLSMIKDKKKQIHPGSRVAWQPDWTLETSWTLFEFGIVHRIGETTLVVHKVKDRVKTGEVLEGGNFYGEIEPIWDSIVDKKTSLRITFNNVELYDPTKIYRRITLS